MKPKYQLIITNSFKRDLKKIEKRGYDIHLIDNVIDKLQNGETLDPKYRDHALKGNWQSFRECHILPDWLLIYKVVEDTLVLSLVRTGSHSDLGLC